MMRIMMQITDVLCVHSFTIVDTAVIFYVILISYYFRYTYSNWYSRVSGGYNDTLVVMNSILIYVNLYFKVACHLN